MFHRSIDYSEILFLIFYSHPHDDVPKYVVSDTIIRYENVALYQRPACGPSHEFTPGIDQLGRCPRYIYIYIYCPLYQSRYHSLLCTCRYTIYPIYIYKCVCLGCVSQRYDDVHKIQ